MRLAAIIISAIVMLFSFAGGGGSSSGGGGGGGGSYSGGGSSYSFSDSDSSGSSSPIATMLAFGIIIAILVFAGLFDRRSRAKHPTSYINSGDESPQEKFIHQEAERIFKAYQEDWSNFNIENIATYTTKPYCEHATLMLELLNSLHRVNKVSQLKVEGVYIMAKIDDQTPLPTEVKVKFYFSGLDEVIDTATGQVLYSDFAHGVNETWNFIYDRQLLKLSGISQPTESADHLVKSLADFAEQNHLCYSPDWGRYALPSRGLIFTDAKMQISDINNHIIGKWDDLLIQLYTYAETPGKPQSYYLVGQITLPKSYLGVIVKSKQQKSKVFRRIDRNYEKFELEWPDFNRRYEVYAASADALPAFELLNPKFMEFLYSKNPNFSLEVADNSIYIFTNIKQVTEQDYSDLLDILAAAHKELKQ